MIGFLIGTLCLVGIIKLVGRGRWSRWGRAGACGHGHGYGFGGRFRGGPGFGRGAMLRWLWSRLETTPSQDKVIASAMDELRATADRVRRDVKAARPELADAVRREQFDETVVGELSHRADEAAQTMRRAVVDAIAKVHAVLDPRQRGILGDLIERGALGGWRGQGGGPYRSVESL